MIASVQEHFKQTWLLSWVLYALHQQTQNWNFKISFYFQCKGHPYSETIPNRSDLHWFMHISGQLKCYSFTCMSLRSSDIIFELKKQAVFVVCEHMGNAGLLLLQ